MTEATLEEQEYLIKELTGSMEPEDNRTLNAILASLRKLQASEAQPVPVEPAHLDFTRKALRFAPPPGAANKRSYRQDKELIEYIDALKLARQAAQEERDLLCESLEELNEKTIALISVNERLKQRAEKAEAVNKRLVELLKERTYDQRIASIKAFNKCTGDLDDKLEAAHQAMSSELLREAGH